MKMTWVLAGILGCWVLTRPAPAAPVLTFNEATGQTGNPYFSGTGGWLFYRNAASPYTLTITGLSWWDENRDGLAMAHPVGIWNTSTGELLRSAVVPAGTAATLEGQWRTVSIMPLTIPADATYYAVGGQEWGTDPDRHVFGTVLTFLDQRIGIIPNAYSSGQTGFAMPNAYIVTSGYGTFGPSFSVAPIPEPAASAVAGFVAVLAVSLRRRLR